MISTWYVHGVTYRVDQVSVYASATSKVPLASSVGVNIYSVLVHENVTVTSTFFMSSLSTFQVIHDSQMRGSLTVRSIHSMVFFFHQVVLIIASSHELVHRVQDHPFGEQEIQLLLHSSHSSGPSTMPSPQYPHSPYGHYSSDCALVVHSEKKARALNVINKIDHAVSHLVRNKFIIYYKNKY